MPEKTYSARSECGVNTYVDKAIGVGHGPWRPSEAAITAADKKVARDDAETAANAAAKKQVDDIIARGCPKRGDPSCSTMRWTDKENGTPLEGTYQILPNERKEGVKAERLIDIVVCGVRIRVDGWRWYVEEQCEYRLTFECVPP